MILGSLLNKKYTLEQKIYSQSSRLTILARHLEISSGSDGSKTYKESIAGVYSEITNSPFSIPLGPHSSVFYCVMQEKNIKSVYKNNLYIIIS